MIRTYQKDLGESLFRREKRPSHMKYESFGGYNFWPEKKYRLTMSEYAHLIFKVVILCH